MALTNIDAALNRIEQNIVTGIVKSNASKRNKTRRAKRAARAISNTNKETVMHTSIESEHIELPNVEAANIEAANIETANIETANIAAANQSAVKGPASRISAAKTCSIKAGFNPSQGKVSNHHNVLRPVFRKPSPITEISLDQHNYPQLDFLMGALGFLTTSESHWITWVNPPQWAQGLLRELAYDAEQLRMLHGDKSHSSFHLFYKSIQASNSSWVIGPAQDLSAKEREILKQAADHFDCRLLLLSSLDASNANGDFRQPQPQTIDLFGDEISDNYFENEQDDTERENSEDSVTAWSPNNAQQQLFAV